jgi:fatty acid desaturase
VGFASGLPSVVTRGVGSEAPQGGAHLGQFSFRIALLHTYFEVGARHGLVIRAHHIGMPLVSPKLKLDFLRRQVLMSRNISGGPPMSIFMGGLNYQIEHHLFPQRR